MTWTDTASHLIGKQPKIKVGLVHIWERIRSSRQTGFGLGGRWLENHVTLYVMWVRAKLPVYSDNQMCPCVQVKEHTILPPSFPKSSIAFALYINQHGMCSCSQIWHEKMLSPGESQFPEYRYLMHWMLQNLRPVRWCVPPCEDPIMGPCHYMWGKPMGS